MIVRGDDLRIGCGRCGHEIGECTCPPPKPHSDTRMFDGECDCDECVACGFYDAQPGDDDVTASSAHEAASRPSDDADR